MAKAFEIGGAIGICFDEMQELLRKDSASIQPFELRKRVLEKLLRSAAGSGGAEVIKISDPFGPAD